MKSRGIESQDIKIVWTEHKMEVLGETVANMGELGEIEYVGETRKWRKVTVPVWVVTKTFQGCAASRHHNSSMHGSTVTIFEYNIIPWWLGTVLTWYLTNFTVHSTILVRVETCGHTESEKWETQEGHTFYGGRWMRGPRGTLPAHQCCIVTNFRIMSERVSYIDIILRILYRSHYCSLLSAL